MTRHAIANGVILADNEPLIRGIIRSVLLQAGQQVFLAANGIEAVDLARQFRARLVLLDIAMPRLNGLLTCKALRALPGYAEVPIVMLTGYDDVRLRNLAHRFKANDFITKPFRPDALLARLSAYLDLPQAMPPSAESTDGNVGIGVRAKVWEAQVRDVGAGNGSRTKVWTRPDGITPEAESQDQRDDKEVMRIHRRAEAKP